MLTRDKLNDRLRREGVKTHKERVEELNRYLSTLSEHHDMYVIVFSSCLKISTS
jgi:protein FAM32A